MGDKPMPTATEYEAALRVNEAYLVACYNDPDRALALRDEAKRALETIKAYEGGRWIFDRDMMGQQILRRVQ